MLSCEKEALPPVVETTGVIDIGLHSLTAQGTLVQAGDEGVSQHGFCWSLAPGPDLEGDSYTELGPREETGNFTSDIQGLDQNTTYFIRAYAVNQAGIAYGKEIAVKTDRTLTVPLVETSRVHTVTEYSAIAGGVVRDDGGSEISSYGICWDTEQNPSIEGMHKAFSDGTGPFFTSIKNLEVTRYADGTLVPFLPQDEWWDSLRVNEKGFCYYNNLHFSTFFWTSSNYNRDNAWARAMGYYFTTMYRGHQDLKEFGFSVRCVRDD